MHVIRKIIEGSKLPSIIELKRYEKIWEPYAIVQKVEVNSPLFSGHAITQSDMNFPYAVHIMLAPAPTNTELKKTRTIIEPSDKEFEVTKYPYSIHML